MRVAAARAGRKVVRTAEAMELATVVEARAREVKVRAREVVAKAKEATATAREGVARVRAVGGTAAAARVAEATEMVVVVWARAAAARVGVERAKEAAVRAAEETVRAVAVTARGAAVRVVAVRERVATAERAEARALNTVARVAHCARQQEAREFREQCVSYEVGGCEPGWFKSEGSSPLRDRIGAWR